MGRSHEVPGQISALTLAREAYRSLEQRRGQITGITDKDRAGTDTSKMVITKDAGQGTTKK